MQKYEQFITIMSLVNNDVKYYSWFISDIDNRLFKLCSMQQQCKQMDWSSIEKITIKHKHKKRREDVQKYHLE